MTLPRAADIALKQAVISGQLETRFWTQNTNDLPAIGHLGEAGRIRSRRHLGINALELHTRFQDRGAALACRRAL
jgi:hypothetical protein